MHDSPRFAFGPSFNVQIVGLEKLKEFVLGLERGNGLFFMTFGKEENIIILFVF